MKKVLLCAAAAGSLLSCGAVNRTMLGATEGTLVKTVAIEKGCPKEEVKVVDRLKKTGSATYAVEACGKRYVYKQIGSVFSEAGSGVEKIK